MLSCNGWVYAASSSFCWAGCSEAGVGRWTLRAVTKGLNRWPATILMRAPVPARAHPFGCDDTAVNPGMRHLRALTVVDRSRNRWPVGHPPGTRVSRLTGAHRLGRCRSLVFRAYISNYRRYVSSAVTTSPTNLSVLATQLDIRYEGNELLTERRTTMVALHQSSTRRTPVGSSHRRLSSRRPLQRTVRH